MKNKQCVCPGCSRHCCAAAPRCKYGRKYFAAQSACCPKKCEQQKMKHKWERFVRREDALWQLMTTARRVKKALVRREITGDELLSALNASEQETLLALLGRLESSVKAAKHV